MRLEREIELSVGTWQIGELTANDTRKILIGQEAEAIVEEEESKEELSAFEEKKSAVKSIVLNLYLSEDDDMAFQILAKLTNRPILDIDSLTDMDLDKLMKEARVLNRRFFGLARRLNGIPRGQTNEDQLSSGGTE
jgi:hypothetical protein